MTRDLCVTWQRATPTETILGLCVVPPSTVTKGWTDRHGQSSRILRPLILVVRLQLRGGSTGWVEGQNSLGPFLVLTPLASPQKKSRLSGSPRVNICPRSNLNPL